MENKLPKEYELVERTDDVYKILSYLRSDEFVLISPRGCVYYTPNDYVNVQDLLPNQTWIVGRNIKYDIVENLSLVQAVEVYKNQIQESVSSLQIKIKRDWCQWMTLNELDYSIVGKEYILDTLCAKDWCVRWRKS